MYSVRDGVLWELRAGKHDLKICSAFEIDSVLCDPTRLLYALSCWALDADDHLVRFRILPRDFFGIANLGLEQTFAAAGLFLWSCAGLVTYLKGNIPASEPVLVDDLRIDENDFREGANRRFRAAREKTVS
jgi:hypothetical protein